MCDRMGNSQLNIFAIGPLLHIAALHPLALFDSIHRRFDQRLVVIGEPAW